MTVWALRGAYVAAREAVAAVLILSIGYRLKVQRLYTRMIPAKMVKGQSLRNRANEQCISETVCSSSLPGLASLKAAIAIFITSCRPYPAGCIVP